MDNRNDSELQDQPAGTAVDRVSGEATERSQEEHELAVLLSNLPDIICRFDSQFRFVYASPAVEAATGSPPGWFIGKTHEAAGVPCELAVVLEQALAKIFSQGEQQRVEFEMANPVGEIRHYSGVGVPELDAEGRVRTVLTIVRDTTEYRRIEQAQRAVERELMLLVEASSQVLASPRSNEVIRTIVDLAQKFIAADAYAVWGKERDSPVWKIRLSDGLSETYMANGLASAASKFSATAPIAFEDVQQGALLADRVAFYRAEGIRSILIVPLRMAGLVEGTIVFYWKTQRKIPAPDIRIATALGNLAAAALSSSELHAQEIRSRQRAEESERRAAFLADAGAVLSSSLDYSATLTNVAHLSVPAFADWCGVDVMDEHGTLDRVAVHHSDPEKIRLAHEFTRKFPPRESDLSLVALRTGQSFLLEEIPDSLLVERARSKEHLDAVRSLGLTSLIVAPLVVEDQILGTITFATADSGRRFSREDFRTAEELARRAGIAIARARLYDRAHQSEERLRLAAEAGRLGIWELSIADNKLDCSSQFRLNLGLADSAQFAYSDFLSGLDLPDRTRWNEVVSDVGSNGGTVDFECGFRTETGGRCWVLLYGGRLREVRSKGTVLGGVSINVTERRELLHREQDARRTAELLNSLGPTLLSELDTGTLVQRVCDIATQVLGADVGCLTYDLQDGSGDRLSSFSGPRQSAVRSEPFEVLGEQPGIVRLTDTRMQEGGASELPPLPPSDFEIRSYLTAPITSRFGRVIGCLWFADSRPASFTAEHEKVVAGIAAQAAIALDNAHLFEESRRTQNALRRSNEELRVVNEDLNQFAYSASHDLQEPIRMVAVYSQLMARRYRAQLDDKATQYLDYMVQGAQRMEMLVRDLLAYTQAANISIEPAEPVDTEAVVRGVIANLRALIDDTGARLHVDVLPPVCIAETHLLQLFQNLIGNALKYRSADRVPEVRISSLTEKDCVQFAVSDNGIGIQKEYMRQVFGIFRRLHTGDQYSGTGIGLAICQRIVERYQGRIWVQSEPGVGSTFYFTAPSAEDRVSQ